MDRHCNQPVIVGIDFVGCHARPIAIGGSDFPRTTVVVNIYDCIVGGLCTAIFTKVVSKGNFYSVCRGFDLGGKHCFGFGCQRVAGCVESFDRAGSGPGDTLVGLLCRQRHGRCQHEA